MKQLNMLLKGTQDLSGGQEMMSFDWRLPWATWLQRKEEIAFFKKSGFKLATHSPECLMNTAEAEIRRHFWNSEL